MKKFKNLLGIIIIGFLIAISIFPNIIINSKNKSGDNQNTTNYIIPVDTYYTYFDSLITGQSNFSASITLSNKYKYGKAYYTNNSNSEVIIRVYGKGYDETKTIDTGNSGEFIFNKSKVLNQKYKVDIKCTTENLNGNFTLCKCNVPF